MKTRHKIIFFTLFLATFSFSAFAFDISKDSEITSIQNELGKPFRLLSKEDTKLDLFDPKKFTFLDAYTEKFGVVVLGTKLVSYRLSNKLLDKKYNNYFKVRSISEEKPNNPDVSVLGIKLGMNKTTAESIITQLPEFEKRSSVTKAQAKYKLTNSSLTVKLDAKSIVTDVELSLN